jgi:uncharacterized membrane protein
MSNQEKTPYWANSLGFIGFCILLIFVIKGCTSIMIEQEKTEQLKIQNKIK